MHGVDLHCLREWTTFYPHARGVRSLIIARAQFFVFSGSEHVFDALSSFFYHWPEYAIDLRRELLLLLLFTGKRSMRRDHFEVINFVA